MRRVVVLNTDGSMQESYCRPGEELEDTDCVTKMTLSDFCADPILSEQPSSAAKWFIHWTVIADDLYTLNGSGFNATATALVHAGAKAHREHGLRVNGQCALTATLSYVKTGETVPAYLSCPMDIYTDDVHRLLRGEKNGAHITHERCRVHTCLR